jgi:hypothetical protein
VYAEETVPFNVSFFYPLSINRTNDASVNFNLGVLYSHVGSVHGVDLTGVASVIGDDLTGAQGAGVAGIVEGSINGYQASGVVSVCEGDVLGFQTSGVVSVTGGAFTGIQGGGVVSVAGGEFNGLQTAGVVNVLGGEGVGGQMGVINVAKNIRGFQIGVVNIAEQMDGIPIGLVNIASNGEVNAIAFGSTFSGINVGAKFLVNNWYSIVALGGGDVQDDFDEQFASSWFYGYRAPIGPAYVEADLGSMSLYDTDDSRVDESDVTHAQLVRLTAGWDITSNFSIFAGVGAGYEYEGGKFDEGDGVAHLFGGITLF